MSMGARGDHPITDLLVYGVNPFPDDIAEMIRLLDTLNSNPRNLFALDAFDWELGDNLEEARIKLKAELQKHGVHHQ
jgi:hypothetical protein